MLTGTTRKKDLFGFPFRRVQGPIYFTHGGPLHLTVEEM